MKGFNSYENQNYEILRRLGVGGFGAVYKVRSYYDNKIYAMKKVTLMNSTSIQQRAALKEAETQAKLHHPNIINLLDSYLKDSSLCLIMELAPNGDLATVIFCYILVH